MNANEFSRATLTRETQRYNGNNKWLHPGRNIVRQHLQAGKPLSEFPGYVSNSCPSCSRNAFPDESMPIDGTYGVDRLVLHVPLVEQFIDPYGVLDHMKDSGIRGDSCAWKHPSGDQTVHLRLDRRTCSLRVEFNPSRFYDLDGFSLCPPGAVSFVVERLMDDLLRAGIPNPIFTVNLTTGDYLTQIEPTWPSQVQISQMDVARDFHTDPNKFNLSMLKGIRAKRSPSTKIHLTADQVETISSCYGPSHGNMKIYDKHRQTAKRNKSNGKEIAPAGTFRYETTVPTRRLRKFAIHTVADLLPDRIEALARSEWETSNWASEFSDTAGWLRKITSSTLSQTEQRMTLEFLLMREHDLTRYYSKKEREEIRPLIRAAGINLHKPLSKQPPETGRLNFDTGKIDWISA